MEIVWRIPASPPERHDYIYRDGIRYVRPYNFEFIAHVKKRWIGKNIVDLFTDEFKGRDREYYVSAVKAGRIQVDGKKVPVSCVVQSSQKISHFLHRHEPPVMAWGVEILHEEADILTVCKPASVPVHPCGQYRKNTVLGILEAEYGLAPLFPVHRLDRLVSGLLIIARNAARADLFRQQIESGQVKKQYIARVTGTFPENEQEVNANISHDPHELRSTTEVGDGQGNDNTPLKWKTAFTKFTRISTNGTHSIVLCEPVTGRTHQIRVHLQYTGHPIANDMLYLTGAFPNRTSEGLSAERAAAKSGISLKRLNSNEKPENNDSHEDFLVDPMCTNCPNLAPKGYNVHEEGLWLHCVKYSGPGWVYECPYPDWAILSS